MYSKYSSALEKSGSVSGVSDVMILLVVTGRLIDDSFFLPATPSAVIDDGEVVNADD